MSQKQKFKIFIEGKKEGLLKKLVSNTSIQELRELLKNDITDEHFFVDEENCKIPKEEEKDFSIHEISSNGNKIYIKKNSNKIFLFLEQNKFDEINASEDTNLNDLRNLSNKMNDNFIFIQNEENEQELEIKQNEEEDFQVKDIIKNGIIKIKNKNVLHNSQNIIIENNDDSKKEIIEDMDKIKKIK